MREAHKEGLLTFTPRAMAERVANPITFEFCGPRFIRASVYAVYRLVCFAVYAVLR